MHVWDAGGLGAIDFDASLVDELYLGYVVENLVVQSAIAEQLAAAERCELLFGRSAQSLAADSTVQLGLDDGTKLHARLLIGADGARSWVRQHAGITTTSSDYGQLGIVCNVRTTREHASTAWQRFLAAGPLAFLPLNDGQSSIVWSNPTLADANRFNFAAVNFESDVFGIPGDYRQADGTIHQISTSSSSHWRQSTT